MNNLSENLRRDSRNKWDSFLAATRAANITLPENSVFTELLKKNITYSNFIAGGLTRHPELLESHDLKKKYSKGEYARKVKAALLEPSPPENEAELSKALRHLRLREMIRIAWRDLADWADLNETMDDLSEFADACTDQALSLLYDWQCEEYGAPSAADGSRQHLVVIAMGKLGGNELNFSSDIDLIFAFSHAGQTKGKSTSVSNEEFFTRLCRRLINVIGATTAEGFVFRVDMRLRPYGESGPIVMSFDAMEEYYQRQGREWERYAWIKARVMAGDKKAGARLLSSLKPFVYRRYLDYGVFESLRDMKQKISFEVKRKGMKNNIKLGPGGIREIEFFGQIFQLTRGGVTPVLQERRIQKVLCFLAQEKYISQNTCDELLAAYDFLRKTEHRLQEFADQQTHDIPSDILGRERLSLSMGFSGYNSFASQLKHHMNSVHLHFQNLLEPKESEESIDQEKKFIKELSTVWKTLDNHERYRPILSSAGFDDPEQAIRILDHLQNDPATRSLSNDGRILLDRLIPIVLKEVGESAHPDRILNHIIDLIKSVEKRTTYLSLLLENPQALAHLVKLTDASPWVVSFLSRHPVLLDELLDVRSLYSQPTRSEIEREIQKKLEQISPADLESQIIELCIFKQINTLRVVTKDVSGALPIMKVSDSLTEIAETILTEVLELCWNHLKDKHGKPDCLLNGNTCDRGFAIIAYGKLGGLELGYGSDLDLVFLHAGSEGQSRNGDIPIDSIHFFSRLGQRIIHTLTASTPAGILYEIDMRLRPDGSSGILVANIESFKEYQNDKAWVWEQQALIKARFICGDPQLKDYFEKIRKEILAQPRDKSTLRKEVSDMRNRMRKEFSRPESDFFDIKQDPGGLIDIEFLVQYLVLLHAHEHGQLTQWTDIVRLLETLTNTGVIDDGTGSFLKETYLIYRSSIHKLSLQEKPAKIPKNEFRDLRKEVKKIWNGTLV